MYRGAGKKRIIKNNIPIHHSVALIGVQHFNDGKQFVPFVAGLHVVHYICHCKRKPQTVRNQAHHPPGSCSV